MTVRIRKAQGATEYAIFIAAVLAGLLALQVYYQRAVKGNVKSRADSIGEQFDNAGGKYVRETRNAASRDMFTNVAGAGDAWSSSNVTTSNVGSDAAWLSATSRSSHSSVLAGVHHTAGGGEVSSSEYVTDASFNAATGAMGAHGTAYLGKVEGSGRSVWDDSGMSAEMQAAQAACVGNPDYEACIDAQLNP